MKKIILVAALLLVGIASASADNRNERPVTVDQLPKVSQEFLAAHFKNLTVAYAVEETKYYGKEYEVTYTDRTEVEFRSDGQWSSVERKYSPVPDAIIPEQIRKFVSAQANIYPGQYNKKIDRDIYTWEIELSNGLEIEFDLKFNVIGYDD